MILFLEILLMIVAVSQEPFTLTEDSWISPEINLIEEEILDPYEYVTPVYHYIGHIVYVETENGEKWQATLVGENEVCLLLEDGEPEYIPYSFEVNSLRFSPNGRFVLFYDLLADSCGLLDTSTHDFIGFRTGLPEDSGFPSISISNTGSTVFGKYSHVSIRGSNGEQVALITGFSSRLMDAKVSNSGSMIVIAETQRLMCLNESGELLWEKNVTLPEDMGRLRIAQFVFSDEDDKLLYSSAHSIHVIDTDTGSLIWSDTSPMFTSFSQISPSGEIWSFGLFEVGRNDPGSYSKTELHFISTDPLSFNNIATYFNKRIYHPQTIAFICALSNAKLHLCGFAGGSSVQGYKFALVTTEGITLWLSEWFSPGLDQISTQYYYNRIGMINRDGSRFFYTDGSLIHFYRIEVL